jgi:hypothetical protein
LLSESVDAAAVPGPGRVGVHASGSGSMQVRRLELVEPK